MPSRTRDVVVIGCSAGGIDALTRIVQDLPPDTAASVLVTQHLARTENPYLVKLLQRVSRLPVVWAEQGAKIERGKVVVAPPDLHLLVSERHVRLSRGPRENLARPSINKLFRSAAAELESRVIGVLLTGMLSDGVAGLLAIRNAGGVTIVQDPADAAFPELPGNALLAMQPDHVLPVHKIGDVLVRLIGRAVEPTTVPMPVLEEARFDREERADIDSLAKLGPQMPIACPDCNGPLWEIGGRGHRRFRCYLGHSCSAFDLLATNADAVEAALDSAVRALSERAITLELLASDAAELGHEQSSETYAAKARDTQRQVELARAFLRELSRVNR
ncbi:MAG: CheB methylesterase [Myxococcales bacterium]|nr:CheB methylesterase [Myxococcales bacterium]